MQDYEEQANDFLKKTGTAIRIRRTGETHRGDWGDRFHSCRYRYHFTLTRNGKSYSGTFYGSIADHDAGNTKIRAYDILSCLQKSDPGATVWEFASEYGYEIRDEKSYKRTEKIWKACRKEYAGVIRLFADVMEDLYEIA